jgi:hypothetical protein
MIVKETKDIDEIKSILCNQAIYDTITDDNCPLVDEFEPPVNDEYRYIAGYIDNKIFGILVFHKYLDGNKCHVQVLPEYRKEHAIKFGEQALCFNGTLPLYAEIPDLYENVLNFAFNNNFRIVEVKENDYIKNGEAYNVNVLRYKQWDS